MALPTHIQSSGWVADVADVVTLTLLSVAAGSTLIVGVSQSSTTARTYTVASTVGGATFTQRQRIANGRVSEIWEAANVGVGTHTLTITASTSATFQGLVVEVGNIDPAAPFDAASQLGSATTTSHLSAAVGAIDTAPNVYCFTVGTTSSDAGTVTAGANWTSLTQGAGNLNYAQYRISAGALTDERGAWTSGTSRADDNCIASFKGTVAAGNPWYAYANQAGGGAAA